MLLSKTILINSPIVNLGECKLSFPTWNGFHIVEILNQVGFHMINLKHVTLQNCSPLLTRAALQLAIVHSDFL